MHSFPGIFGNNDASSILLSPQIYRVSRSIPIPNPDLSKRQLAKRIAKIPGVYEVHIISGEYDLLLKVRGKSLEDIGKLVVDKLRQLKGVGKTLTFACFETVKEEL